MAKSGALRRWGEFCQTASSIQLRREPKFSALHLSALKRLWPEGLARGTIVEIHGSRSSGRMSVCLHILARATARGEICAVVDLYDTFDPASAVAAGVPLNRLLWVRCRGNLEHAIRATDLLLHAGGFGFVLLDLCEANPRLLNRIPLSYWHRFRRVIEHTPTVLLVCGGSAQAKSCAKSSLRLKVKVFNWLGDSPFRLLGGITANALLESTTTARPEPLLIETVA